MFMRRKREKDKGRERKRREKKDNCVRGEGREDVGGESERGRNIGEPASELRRERERK